MKNNVEFTTTVFSLLKDEIADGIRHGLKKILPEENTGSKNDHPASGWIPVGKISDFPVGVAKRIHVGETEIVVVSNNEGIFAEKLDHVRLPLCVLDHASLAVDMNQSWPSNAVFSVLTLEMKLT